MQIFNQREDHVYATILAIPNYRLQPTGKTSVTFYEAPAGSPEAIRAWFYPGDNFGQEFYYPKGRASELAAVTHQTVPEVPADMEAKLAMPATTPAPTAAPEPTPAPAEAAPTPAPAPEPAPMAAQTPAAPQDNTPAPAPMPKTASDLPLISLLGFASLIAAAGVRKFARRQS